MLIERHAITERLFGFAPSELGCALAPGAGGVDRRGLFVLIGNLAISLVAGLSKLRVTRLG